MAGGNREMEKKNRLKWRMGKKKRRYGIYMRI